MANLLIVEDDIDIATGIAEYLEAQGHRLDFAYNGKQAIQHIEDHVYDLILLDINMPVLDGLAVCRSLTQEKLARIPVIIMSARGETDDILTGFQSGAWDYLVKPFSFAELSARINVGLAKSTPIVQESADYQGLCIDKSAFTLTYQQHSLQLHQTGFDILWLLINHAPDVVKTHTLHRQLWDEEMPESNPLRAHIYKLRKQLMNTFQQEFIETVKGVGYKLNVK